MGGLPALALSSKGGKPPMAPFGHLLCRGQKRGPFGRNRRLAADGDGRGFVLRWGRTTRKGRREPSAGRSLAAARPGAFRAARIPPDARQRRRLQRDSCTIRRATRRRSNGSSCTTSWPSTSTFPLVDPRRHRLRVPRRHVRPRRRILVVAASPEALAAAGGPADALGPFAGRLANDGERLELVNNSDRLMNTVEYGDSDALAGRAGRLRHVAGQARSGHRQRAGRELGLQRPRGRHARRARTSPMVPNPPTRPRPSRSCRSTRPGPTTSRARSWEPPGASRATKTAPGRPARDCSTSRKPRSPARRTRRSRWDRSRSTSAPSSLCPRARSPRCGCATSSTTAPCSTSTGRRSIASTCPRATSTARRRPIPT